MNVYPTIDMEATGNRIRDLRKENHIKVLDIATYMGFESQQAVYKWQRGESLPTVDNLFALSRLFGTTMEDILVEHRSGGESSPLDGVDGIGKQMAHYFITKTTGAMKKRVSYRQKSHMRSAIWWAYCVVRRERAWVS